MKRPDTKGIEANTQYGGSYLSLNRHTEDVLELIAYIEYQDKHLEQLEKFKDAIIRVHTSMNGNFGHFESVDEVIDELEKDEGRK